MLSVYILFIMHVMLYNGKPVYSSFIYFGGFLCVLYQRGINVYSDLVWVQIMIGQMNFPGWILRIDCLVNHAHNMFCSLNDM